MSVRTRDILIVDDDNRTFMIFFAATDSYA